ncbi:MAG: AAA domain-containing protein, partial [Armatimonadota bacterium]
KQVEVVPKLRSVDGEVFEASFGVSAYSLFEKLIGGEKRTLWLTDHFRCPPPVIAFANKQFYGGRLRIHTQNHEPEPITHEKVHGNHRRNADGSATNDEQIRRALQLLVELASKYPKNTIGLVAPYRAFIDDVLDILHTNPAYTILQEKLEKQELIIGTAHRFQGSEVDYLVFATVVGDNGSGRESGWVENPNLFNVAITRARRKLTILISPVFEKHLFLTRRLLKAKPVLSDESSVDERKGFIKEVTSELERLGIAFRAGAIYHGDPVDLLEDSDEPKWGVLLVSWDDVVIWKPLDFLRFLERQHILKQRRLLLWRIFPPEFENLVAELLVVGERRWK